MTEVLAAATARRAVVTAARLAADLSAVGVRPGQTLLVHASLREIGGAGRVEGGAQAVVGALLQVLGGDGTLVTGAGTPENSVTSRAFLARVAGLSRKQVAEFRRRMPAFDRQVTPTSVGAVAEAVRTSAGAFRSAHPQSSFAAVGSKARFLMEDHSVRCHLGEDSPLAKLYRQDAWILLLGTGYQACSAFHLAEYRYPGRPPARTYRCVVATDGKRDWLKYRDAVLDDSDFEAIGASFENATSLDVGQVGGAPCRMIPMRQVVDFAAKWMATHRAGFRSPVSAGFFQPWVRSHILMSPTQCRRVPSDWKAAECTDPGGLQMTDRFSS